MAQLRRLYDSVGESGFRNKTTLVRTSCGIQHRGTIAYAMAYIRVDRSDLWTAFALICLSRGVVPHFWGFDSEWSATCFIQHTVELALGYSPYCKLCPSLAFVANVC